MQSMPTGPLIAIACGGTGGHLFPGIAIGQVLAEYGCSVTLLISPKQIDQQAVRSFSDLSVVTLPAEGLTRGAWVQFARAFWTAYRLAKETFQTAKPSAVLGMGGFISAPPLLAAKQIKTRAFLHESNAVPGRANRWLAPLMDQVFVGFPQAAYRLRNRRVTVTGTPVRAQFQQSDPLACRMALGLEPHRPVVLVVGGSQGASAINQLVVQSLPALAAARSDLQWLHLSGPAGVEPLRKEYLANNQKAVVLPFLTEMELALGAATVAISRAGASSLAELAAMRVPSILIPYPTAVNDHQTCNARAFVEAGAARMLDQESASGEFLVPLILSLLSNESLRIQMQSALGGWHFPHAAEQIAARILAVIPSTHFQSAAGCKPVPPPKASGRGLNPRSSRAAGAERTQQPATRAIFGPEPNRMLQSPTRR